jgi:zinc finger BED domain-containing protein 1 (E3 SUMO-protein ligase ZBED1)
MLFFDSSFNMPGEQKIKTMISKSYKYNRENLMNLLNETATTVSLTTDLWSSRAKHGYLGVTATWITPDFKIKDVMLEIKYAPSPHTAKTIAELLYQCITSWNLEGRVMAIVTDNGANIKSTFPILIQKDKCENIHRIPCAAHTLQLAIGKGLAPVEILIARVKRIINFFSTQKQIEKLEEAQSKLHYQDILRCIQDVSTRWNSSYYAWDRLFYLKDAITRLQADLLTSTNREDKNDGNKLRKIMLSEEEWELLDQLIDLLMPFENATRNFSGGTYVTLSTIISTIKKLIFDLACDSSLDNINYLDENTIFETETFTNELLIEIEDEEIISNISKRRVSIKNPLDTTGILEKVKNNIYSALIYYWNFSNDIELITSLLDPRYKTLDFVESEDEKKRIIQKLRNELDPNNLSSVESSSPTTLLTNNAEFSLRSHKEYRQYRQMRNKNLIQSNINTNIDEIDSYLAKPVVLENVNPLEWWQVNIQLFPKLSKIARKYLGIPATSVSCERLFSHANNIITTKRIRLDTDLAGKMLFLKRNLNSMEVFAKEWDEIEKNN